MKTELKQDKTLAVFGGKQRNAVTLAGQHSLHFRNTTGGRMTIKSLNLYSKDDGFNIAC